MQNTFLSEKQNQKLTTMTTINNKILATIKVHSNNIFFDSILFSFYWIFYLYFKCYTLSWFLIPKPLSHPPPPTSEGVPQPN